MLWLRKFRMEKRKATFCFVMVAALWVLCCTPRGAGIYLLAPPVLMDVGQTLGVGSGTGSESWQLGHEYRVGISLEALRTYMKKGANPQLTDS